MTVIFGMLVHLTLFSRSLVKLQGQKTAFGVNNVGRLKTKGYQLSLIDPRDKIVQQTELDDLCDKLQWSSVGARGFYQLS